MKMPAWLESVSPGHLDRVYLNEASPRKSGLFIRHLCRCFPSLFGPQSLATLDAADAREAGEVGSEGVQAESEGPAEYPDFVTMIASVGFYPGVLSQLRNAILAHAGAGRGPRKNPTARAMRPVFFEHFGDPRSPVERDPSWLTSTVLKLAEGMYESRDFSPMPILADALQDAGCDHTDVLDHCRSDGPHVRGCWVVDLVLGKS